LAGVARQPRLIGRQRVVAAGDVQHQFATEASFLDVDLGVADGNAGEREGAVGAGEHLRAGREAPVADVARNSRWKLFGVGGYVDGCACDRIGSIGRVHTAVDDATARACRRLRTAHLTAAVARATRATTSARAAAVAAA